MGSYHKTQRQQQSNLLTLKTVPSAAVHQLHLEMQMHHRALQAAFQQTLLAPKKKKNKKPTENAQANVIYSLKGKEKQNSNKIKKTQQQQTRNHHHQKIRTEDTDFFL